jgi:hypothetical protein
MKIELAGQFPKNTPVSNFMNIRQWGPSYSMRKDGQKGRRKDGQKGRRKDGHDNFTNTPKKGNIKNPSIRTQSWRLSSVKIARIEIWLAVLYFQWLIQEFFSGGSTNSVEDRGQRERGSEGGGPLIRVPLNLQMSETRILIRLLRMYFPRNREFGSALSKLRNFGGWFEPPQTLPRYATVYFPLYISCYSKICRPKNSVLLLLHRN